MNHFYSCAEDHHVETTIVYAGENSDFGNGTYLFKDEACTKPLSVKETIEWFFRDMTVFYTMGKFYLKPIGIRLWNKDFDATYDINEAAAAMVLLPDDRNTYMVVAVGSEQYIPA